MSRVQSLIDKLPLIDENILAEAADMPMLFVEAARYRVSKMRAKYRASVALEEFEANRGLRIRQSMEAKKPTEKYIKSKVMKDPRYAELKAGVHAAEAREEFSKLLLEAFRMRKDAIKIIYDAEHYEGGKASGEVERLEQGRLLRNRARELQARHIRNRKR